MNSKKKNIVGVVIVVIGIIIISAAVVYGVSRLNKTKKLKAEYTVLLDETLSGVYEDEDCVKYHITDISYSIVDFRRNNRGAYSASVVLDCKSTYSGLDSLDASLLAYAIADYVPGYISEVDTTTGDHITLEGSNARQMLTINVNGECIQSPSKSSYSKPEKHKCAICGETEGTTQITAQAANGKWDDSWYCPKHYADAWQYYYGNKN